MPEFCDVALPVPLDMAFTYSIDGEATPVVGGRVLVPFRQQRMTGIVIETHDRKPSVATKKVLAVLDSAPVLDDHLLRLGRWIADYYLAPIGEVFRTMLPLSAEFKRVVGYRITDEGHMALHLAGMSGSSARSQRSPEDQAAEFRVLDYLAARVSELEVESGTNGDGAANGNIGTNGKGTAVAPGRALVREETLRSATGISKSILVGMVRKKWLAREDVSAPRDAIRTIKVAQLKSAEGKLNDNQRILVETWPPSAERSKSKSSNRSTPREQRSTR